MSNSELSSVVVQDLVRALEAEGFPEIAFMQDMEGLIPRNKGALLMRTALPRSSDHHLLAPFTSDSQWAQVRDELVAKHGYEDCSPKDGSAKILRRVAAAAPVVV